MQFLKYIFDNFDRIKNWEDFTFLAMSHLFKRQRKNLKIMNKFKMKMAISSQGAEWTLFFFFF